MTDKQWKAYIKRRDELRCFDSMGRPVHKIGLCMCIDCCNNRRLAELERGRRMTEHKVHPDG